MEPHRYSTAMPMNRFVTCRGGPVRVLSALLVDNKTQNNCLRVFSFTVKGAEIHAIMSISTVSIRGVLGMLAVRCRRLQSSWRRDAASFTRCNVEGTAVRRDVVGAQAK